MVAEGLIVGVDVAVNVADGGIAVGDGFSVGIADGGTRVGVALGGIVGCTVSVAVGRNVGEFVTVAEGLSVTVGCTVAVAISVAFAGRAVSDAARAWIALVVFVGFTSVAVGTSVLGGNVGMTCVPVGSVEDVLEAATVTTVETATDGIIVTSDAGFNVGSTTVCVAVVCVDACATRVVGCGDGVAPWPAPPESERIIANATAKASIPTAIIATINSFPMSRCMFYPSASSILVIGSAK